MRLIGVLCWADENPLWLMASVTAIAPALDHLIVLDGKYALYPGATTDAASPLEQTTAILEACSAANLGVTLHRPTTAYIGNEVEKRNLSLRFAEHLKESDDDWLVVFDADMVARKFDPAYLRHDLEQSDHLVATYARYESPDDEGFTPIRGLYRLTPGLLYGPAHWTISVPSSDGTILWLWGNPGYHTPYMDALDVTAALRFDHRNTRRDPARTDRATTYYQRREQLGIERLADTFVQNLDGDWVNVRDRAWHQ